MDSNLPSIRDASDLTFFCRFEGIDEGIERVHFSSKKLTDLGFQYRYTVEDMFDSAVESCLEKQLLPLQTVDETGKGGKAAANGNGKAGADLGAE